MTVLASQPSVSIETETTQRMRAAELAGLADGVHDLAEKLLIGDVLTGPGVSGALDDLPAEAFDLVGGHRRGSCRRARRPLRAARCR